MSLRFLLRFFPPIFAGLFLVLLPLLPGCETQNQTFIGPPHAEEDVDYALPPGEFGLTKLDPKDYPDMRAAFMNKAGLEQAVDKSIQYLHSPSSARFYPSGPKDPITHDQVLATLLDFKIMLHSVQSGDQFQQQVLARYDVWTSKGYNGRGDVWFTGYYTPNFHGSAYQTPQFRFPIYKRPGDLLSDPITGQVIGQKMPDGSIRPYPTRQEIVQRNLLRGQELLWFSDPLQPYIIQVQGSAKVLLSDGTYKYIGYAGKNGRDYRGLGAELVKDGKIQKKQLSLPAIMAYFQAHPGEEDQYILRNDSFAFLKEYDPKEWPSGSLGVQVTPHRSLATDKSIFPRASLTFLQNQMPAGGSQLASYTGLFLDQDTGGAIQAAGRADIYMGIGDAAGQEAGREFSQGRLFYLFLKPELVPQTAFSGLHARPGNMATATAAMPAAATRPATPASVPAATDSEIFPGGRVR